MNGEVSSFLKRFRGDSVEVFANGCCYWFAVIMFWRFIRDDSEIMYDQVANHFGTRVGDKIYDITGEVTEEYDWESWNDIEDTLLKKKIARDCILF